MKKTQMFAVFAFVSTVLGGCSVSSTDEAVDETEQGLRVDCAEDPTYFGCQPPPPPPPPPGGIYLPPPAVTPDNIIVECAIPDEEGYCSCPPCDCSGGACGLVSGFGHGVDLTCGGPTRIKPVGGTMLHPETPVWFAGADNGPGKPKGRFLISSMAIMFDSSTPDFTGWIAQTDKDGHPWYPGSGYPTTNYVTVNNNGVHQWGFGLLDNPAGIAIDQVNGKIYIADTANIAGPEEPWHSRIVVLHGFASNDSANPYDAGTWSHDIDLAFQPNDLAFDEETGALLVTRTGFDGGPVQGVYEVTNPAQPGSASVSLWLDTTAAFPGANAITYKRLVDWNDGQGYRPTVAFATLGSSYDFDHPANQNGKIVMVNRHNKNQRKVFSTGRLYDGLEFRSTLGGPRLTAVSITDRMVWDFNPAGANGSAGVAWQDLSNFIEQGAGVGATPNTVGQRVMVCSLHKDCVVIGAQ